MQGDAQVIQFLNKVLYNELTAINQYFLHAKMHKHWGLEGLSKRAYRKSIQDMKQADALSERILFLEGLPNFQALGKLRIGEGPRESLACDLALALAELPILREAIAHCETAGDYVSRTLLDGVLEAEEAHVDWLETQLDLITRVGEQNYLQEMIED